MKKNNPINFTRLFFVFFFGAILSSVIITYYKVVVLKDFVSYTNEEDVPQASEFYKSLFKQ